MDLFLLELDIGLSFNDTGSNTMSATNVFRFFKVYCTPFIVSIGLVANALAIYAYRSSGLSSFASITYLTFLSITDSVFLLTLLLVWSALYDLRLMFSDWWCIVTTYFTEMTIFMSLWCVTALTVERYLQNCRPWIFSKMRINDLNICAGFVVLAISAIGIVVYLNLSLTMGIVWSDHGPLCSRLPYFLNIKQTLSKLDLAFNFALPYSVLFVVTIMNMHHYRKQSSKDGYVVSSDQPPNRAASTSTTVTHQPLRKLQTELEINRLCIVMAGSFLVFSLPCHAFRTIILLLGYILGEHSSIMSPRAFHWQQLLLYLFFSRSAFNLFLALSSSGMLRKVFFAHCKSKSRTGQEEDHVTMEMETTGETSAQPV